MKQLHNCVLMRRWSECCENTSPMRVVIIMMIPLPPQPQLHDDDDQILIQQCCSSRCRQPLIVKSFSKGLLSKEAEGV